MADPEDNWPVVLRILHQMIDIRKYTVTGDIDTFDYTFENLQHYEAKDPVGRNVLILLLNSRNNSARRKLKKDDIDDLIALVTELNNAKGVTTKAYYQDILLVSNRRFGGKSNINTIIFSPLIHYREMLWCYYVGDLFTNVSLHDLQPKVLAVLTEKEKEELLVKRNITENQLPDSKTGDPLIKFLGLRKGQVILLDYTFDLPFSISPNYQEYRLITGGEPPRRKR